MGLGVVDPEGGSPRKKWHLRISYAGAPVRAVAEELLSGGRVLSRDDEVHLSWAGGSHSRGLIYIRDASPGADYVLKVVVQALAEAEIRRLRLPDPAGIARPLPTAWMPLINSTAQAWELFNCRVESVDFRSL